MPIPVSIARYVCLSGKTFKITTEPPWTNKILSVVKQFNNGTICRFLLQSHHVQKTFFY
jgi:hypothetical protein